MPGLQPCQVPANCDLGQAAGPRGRGPHFPVYMGQVHRGKPWRELSVLLGPMPRRWWPLSQPLSDKEDLAAGHVLSGGGQPSVTG